MNYWNLIPWTISLISLIVCGLSFFHNVMVRQSQLLKETNQIKLEEEHLQSMESISEDLVFLHTQHSLHPQYEMVKGTTTEQAFDIVSVDKTNKKLYTTRIGVGKDREFKYAIN